MIYCQWRYVPEQIYSDDARRIADEMTLHAIAKSTGWAVFALATGRPANHMAYPRRQDAVRDMKWDRDNYLYLEIHGMTPREAQAVLSYARFLHDQGWRLPDPEFDYDASMPTYSWDQLANARHLLSGGKDLYGDYRSGQEQRSGTTAVAAVQGWNSADRAIDWVQPVTYP
jgi:hypothetical protein